MSNDFVINVNFDQFGSQIEYEDLRDTLKSEKEEKVNILVNDIIKQTKTNGSFFVSISKKNIQIIDTRGNTIHVKNTSDLISLTQAIFGEQFNTVSIICNPSYSEQSNEQTLEPYSVEDPAESSVGHADTILPIMRHTTHPATCRIIEHIHADEFGENSALEGWTGYNALTYLDHFLKNREELEGYGYSLPADFENLVSESLYLNSLISTGDLEEAQNKMEEKLRQGDSLILLGGWTGVPNGHAMIYEVIPEQDGTCTFRIFNRGKGISQFHFQAEVDIKIKFSPLVEWRGISLDNILTYNLVSAIYEQTQLAYLEDEKGTKTNYGPADIYLALKETCMPKEEVFVLEYEGDPLLMTPQRSGTCGWASLLGFLRTKMNKENYKRFKCDMKLQSLLDFLNNRASDDHSISEFGKQLLITKSLEKLSRSIDRLYQENIVGEDYVIEATHLIQDVQQQYQIIHKPYFEETEALPQVFKFLHTPVKEKPIYHTLQNLENRVPLQKHYQLNEELKTLSFDAEHILASVHTVAEIVEKAWLKGCDLESYFALHNKLRALPLDENFWISTFENDPGMAEEMVIALGRLLEVYFKTCITKPDSSSIDPEQLLNSAKIMYISQLLTRLICPQWVDVCISSFNLNEFTDFAMSLETGLNLLNKNIEDDLKVVEKINQRKDESINYMTGFSSSSKGIRIVFPKYLFEDNYEDGMTQLISKIKNQTTINDESYNNLEKYQQVARLHMNTDSFPDWFNTMRNTMFYCHLLNTFSFKMPNQLNRDDDINLKWALEENESFSSIRISFDNIEMNPKNLSNNYPFFCSVNNEDVECTAFLRHRLRAFREQENTIVTEQNIYHNITPQELELYKEIAYIQIEEKLRLPLLLEFFVNHPELLSNPVYQNFLQMNLFLPGYLTNALKTEGFDAKLQLFLNTFYKNFFNNNQLQPLVFILRLSRHLDKHQKGLGVPDNFKKMTDLLHQEAIDVLDKSAIYGEIIASLNEKTELNEREVALLLEGLIHLSRHPTPIGWDDEYLKREISECPYKHASSIRDALVKDGVINHDMINHIVQKTDRSFHPCTWKLTSAPDSFPELHSERGNYDFYPLLGHLRLPGTKGSIPQHIKNHQSFKKLFPSIQHATQLEQGAYSFLDPFDCETIVRDFDNKLAIEQKRGVFQKQWHRYVPKEKFLAVLKESGKEISKLGSVYFLQHYTCWENLEEHPPTILIVDPKTGKEVYQVSTQVIPTGALAILKIERLIDKAVLRLDRFYVNNIEQPEYVHTWFINNLLFEVELPRYALKLQIDTQDPSKIVCQQLPPGYHLKFKEKLPILGSYKHYLVFENESGNKKALFPALDFTEPKTRSKEVHEIIYDVDWKVKRTAKRQRAYYIFDVKEKQLSTKSREGNLYLASLYLLHQDYEQAAHHLKNYGSKLRAYSLEEKKILNNIATTNKVTGNIAGNAWGIQCYASYLLVKNAKEFPSKENSVANAKDLEENLRVLMTNYSEYLGHLNNIKALKLSKDEELYVLRNLKTLNNNFRARQSALMQVEHSTESKLPTETVPAFIPASHLDFKSIKPGYITWSKNSFLENHYNDRFITRTFLKSMNETPSFVNLYAMLYEHPEEIDFFRTGLIYLKAHAKNNNDKLAAMLLLVVADNLSEFPSITFSTQSEEFNKLWPGIVKKGEELARKNPPKIPAKPPGSRFLPAVPLAGRESHMTPSIGDLSFRVDLNEPLVQPFEKELWFSEAPPSAKPAVNSVGAKKPIQDILNNLLLHKGDTEFELFSPLVQTEIKRLKTDLEAFENQEKKPRYLLNENALEEITQKMEESAAIDKQEMDKLKGMIMAIAKQAPPTYFGECRSFLLELGGENPPLKLEELLINFAKQDPSALQNRNSALDEESITYLYALLAEYLLVATRRQQAIRVLKEVSIYVSLEKMDHAHIEERNEAIQQIVSSLSVERVYDVEKKPAFLVFEYFANIMMRENQIKMIDDILSGGEINQIKELIMGSGKSKVLMPLLGLLRADGHRLSMMIVPESLFQSVSRDTQDLLKDAFGKELKTFSFDRNTDFDLLTLQNILYEIKEIRDQKQCLMITSKSIHCFLLKFIEQSIKHFQSGEEISPELVVMRDILNFLSSNSWPLLDEVDLLLNVMHEVSFSLGQAAPPSIEEAEIIGDLYDILYTDPMIKQLAKLDSDPNPISEASTLTENIYFEKIQKPLAKAFIERYKHKTFSRRNFQKLVNEFFQNKTPAEEERLLDYLCRTAGKEEDAQAFFNQQAPEIRELLAMAGEEISNYLPHTLLKPCDEKYGIDSESNGLLAIPFSSANVPSKGSEFAIHHITMNFTYQYYVKKGLSQAMLKSLLAKLQASARQEINESNDEKTLEQTAAWVIYQEIKGSLNLPLFNLTDKQIKHLLKDINKTSTKLLAVIKHTILPQIVIYDKKISSTSHNLVSLFTKLSGFTGTLWNGSSLHRKLSPEPSLGTDALTINKLWENSYDAIEVIQGGSSKDMLEELKSLNLSFDLLGDAGGYFKDVDNETAATFLAAMTNKSGVYYNRLGDQVLWNNKQNSHHLLAETTVKESERITFLDQAHTTGADVPQKSTAIGLITIGPNMFLRDLNQSVWRLRGLDKTQRVKFVISKDVEAIIQQTLKLEPHTPLTFAEILSFVIINQIKQQGKENYRALNQELEEVGQKILLDTLLDTSSTPDACATAVKKFGNMWIKTSNLSAAEMYGRIPQQIDSDDRLKNLVDNFSSILEGEQHRMQQAEIRKIAEKYKDKLPLKVTSTVGAKELTVEQEQQSVSEKQSELTQFSSMGEQKLELLETKDTNDLRSIKVTAEIYSTTLVPEENFKSIDVRLFTGRAQPMHIIPLEIYFSNAPGLEKYADCFEGINISLNMLQIPNNINIQANDIKFFGRFHKQIHNMLIEEDGEITLINVRESERRLNQPNIYNIQLGFLNSNGKVSDEVFEKIVKIKFLKGEVNYTSKEVQFLRKWIQNNDPQKMHELFTKHIIKYLFKKTKDYEHSSLQRLFNELL